MCCANNFIFEKTKQLYVYYSEIKLRHFVNFYSYDETVCDVTSTYFYNNNINNYKEDVTHC